MENKIKGGRADKMSCEDIARKHSVFVGTIKKQLEMGMKVEEEHTKDKAKAKEIAMDHLAEFPDYYTRLHKMEKNATKKTESKESMGADASGSYEGSLSAPILKKDIHKLHNWKTSKKEVKEMDAGVSAGAMYDGPIGTAGPSSPMDKTKKKRKDPLKINNAKSKMGGASVTGASTKDMIATKKGFPRFGGPEGKFVEIDNKCKKFPYCNQGAGSDRAFGKSSPIKLKEIYMLKDAIIEASKKYGISADVITDMVIKEAYELPGGIDLSPTKTWHKGGKKEDYNYIYNIVTNEPLDITIKDETEFEKIKLILRKNNIRFNESKRLRTDNDIEPESPISKDEDIIWPDDNDDDDIFANMK